MSSVLTFLDTSSSEQMILNNNDLWSELKQIIELNIAFHLRRKVSLWVPRKKKIMEKPTITATQAVTQAADKDCKKV